MTEFAIPVEPEHLGPDATDADADAYCAWADKWFAANYPELDVEHVRAPGHTPRDVHDEEQECWAAWCDQDAPGAARNTPAPAAHTTYTVRGPVRGVVARSVTLLEAHAAQQSDIDSCARLSGGAYSDVTIQRDDGLPLTEEEATLGQE